MVELRVALMADHWVVMMVDRLVEYLVGSKAVQLAEQSVD